ncbi:MAG: hypothetical protein HY514_04180 [Candidatus Aenigmarchaeota archaeon]|nr:hypothetical protein [Candidatus Aenigmarchaeota archaeon]
MKCDKCNMALKAISVKMLGETFKAKECPACRSRIVNLDIAMKLHDKIVPKLKCEKRIIKIGDSSAITIPKGIRHFFLPGSVVTLDFDPQEMAMTIRKE